MHWLAFARPGCLLGVIAVVLAGCRTPPAPAPEAETALRRIKSVLIVPPQVGYFLVSPGIAEHLPDEEHQVTAQLTPALEELVAAKNLTVARPPAGAAGEALVRDLQSAMDDALPRDAPVPRPNPIGVPVPAASFPLDTAIDSRLAASATARTGADAILWCRYVAYRKSGGQQLLDVLNGTLETKLTGLQPISDGPEAGILTMALVDAATGRVLWTGAAKIIKGGWNVTVPNTATRVFATLPGETP